MSLGFLLLFLFSIITSIGAGQMEPIEIKEQIGDMEFSYTPVSGVSLSVAGVPIIKGSYVVVVNPGWTENYFNSLIIAKRFEQSAQVQLHKDGKKIILTLRTIPSPEAGETEEIFYGTQIFTLSADNTCSMTLEFKLIKNVPAVFEWKAGGINPVPIIGCAYSAVNDRQTTTSLIPLKAVGSEIEECMLARDFNRLKINSRLGAIEIVAQPEASFFDYRKNKWAESNNPIFWLGFRERKITSGKLHKYNITFHFSRDMRMIQKKAQPITMKAELTRVDNALMPEWEQKYILPTPKHLRYTNTLFPLSSDTKIYVGKNPGTGLENAMNFFLEELRELYGIEPQVIKEEGTQVTLTANSIFVGEVDRYSVPTKLCEQEQQKLPENEEGYCLVANDKLVSVAAKTEKGIFYGLTTLLQLIKVSEQGVFIKGAEITDFPALKFRGIHCLSGKDAGDEIARAIRTLMARFKINSLVWECEYIIWDSHPEIAHKEYGMEKSEARKVITAAQKHFVELIPLVQSLGHCEWIFTNDQNLDLAEDPQHRYAYCPTNPDTYKFIFSVYQEALDFFKPRYFHIGHDEVTMVGDFPSRSRASGKSVTELIMEDIQKLHGWFTERGVKIMLWGDMFLAPGEGTDACFAPSIGEARKRRALLPRDAIICDWHYAVAEPAEYKSLKVFRDSGFKTIGAAWFRSDNIRNLAQACVMFGVEGFLQTTWAGFNFKITDNEAEWHQYYAYLWAAEYAWSGKNTPIMELPFDAKQVFLDLWFEKKPEKKKRSGFMVDLRPWYNRRLEDEPERGGWIGLGPECDFSAFPLGKNRFGETLFQVEKNERGEAAVMLAGKMNPPGDFPETIEIKLENVTATELHFLLNTTFATKNGLQVGEIIIKYADDTTETQQLIYGRNIFAFNEINAGKEARIAWQGTTKNGEIIRVWDVRWKNPQPEKKITTLILRSALTEAAPILLAITGIN